MLTAEQVVAAQKANLETLFGLTQKAFEGVEKLVELNIQASKAALNESAAHSQAVLSVKDAQELLALQAGLMQPLAEKTAAYSRHQNPLILREGLLVAFFLAGLVVLGGLQQWWLQPLLTGIEPTALFFIATGLTAITDNAALTYLASLVQGVSDEFKYAIVAGAVTGGGLSIIANAPNPAGIAILKVGPALTYGLREALFSLSMMEKELVPEEKRANFIETLDAVMLASPANWEKHYHGDEKHLAQCRKYSYSDRARYYIGQPEVVAAMNKLFDNLREYPIPMNMLHQYMPISYAKIREGKLKLDPRELAMDGIVQFMLDYESAV